VRVYETFVEEHASCIIMELLEGKSLGQLLQDGPLPLPRARELALQVAEALGYAHSQEIVHRDIKPDNVMVLPGDQVKVTDFGIARILQPDTSLQTIATTGMRMGTPSYMAPEQIEGKQIDARTDVYALGAMLYHMVTGRPPFEGSDALAVAVKHLQEEPVPPSQIDPAIPADWDALILKAMAKDPSKRFQSATDMQKAIASLGEEAGSPASTPRPMPRLLAAIGLVLAGIIGAAGLWAHVAASHSSTLSARLDGYFSSLAAGGHLSGTVLVAKGHNPVFVKGYGYADRAAHVPNGPNTKYADVAISTDLSIAELEYVIQGGYVRLGNRICAYLPSCSASWKRITIRSLLDGTSHLPDYSWGHPGNTVRQSLAACQAQPLDPSSFGKVEYQVCTNLVLALISEKFNGNSLNGSPWGENQMFQLAGMHSSGQMTDAILSPQRALDYADGVPDSRTTYNDYFVAYTTAPDEYAFDNALFGGKLLSQPYLSAMISPRFAVDPSSPGVSHPRWGHYWQIGSLFGHRVIFTYAEINRFLSVNMHFPDAGLTVIVLSNDSSTDVLGIGIHAAALALGTQMRSTPPGTHVPHALLGTYRRILTVADARESLSFGSVIGSRLMLTIYPKYLHFFYLGSPTDEYYQAIPDGRVELTGLLPTTDNNNFCFVQPDITPPTGYYRWSLKGKILTITTVNDNQCRDRIAILAGKWTKTG
jgi:CubicO group peptidase (beta-lactamase class C family)